MTIAEPDEAEMEEVDWAALHELEEHVLDLAARGPIASEDWLRLWQKGLAITKSRPHLLEALMYRKPDDVEIPG